MAKYKDKWKTTFPTSIGNQTRPEDGVDNTQEYNTDGLPQYMANDPVRYDLQNAVNSQLVSNDERLNEKIKRTSDDLAAHNKDPKAHATGIAGNAATASKLASPRTISLTGKATGSASFDGSANAAINVTSVNADTASKLSTARKINITGNAVGAATFDGSGDISISTTVNESKHAVNADVAKTLQLVGGDGSQKPTTFNWLGKPGQPQWLWGNNDDVNTYVYNPSNFHVAAANNDGDGANIANTYLKKSGGNMNGPLNFTNFTWNLVGDDSYMGDHNVSGTFCVKGATGDTGIALFKQGSDSDYARISYNGGNINFNKTIGGNLAGNADTATNANHASSADSAADVTNATVSPGVSNINGVTVPASGVINDLNAVTGSTDLTSTNKLRSYIGSIYNGNWYDAISIRHRNGETDGTNFGLLIYSNLTDNWDTIHYKKQCSGWTEERTLLDSANYNAYAPTKTGGGASGTWDINISGNANTANVAKTLEITDGGGARANSSFHWVGQGGQPQWLWGSNDEINNYVYDPSNFHVASANSAGNADTVDGYHASDLFRHLGGNQTPVITDIFDRAGTIDMTTMSAADKATHKANINKARNATQNIWNTDTGISAYGGDYDMANGYGCGSLKLTQSYKNFDKILVVGANDKGELLIYKLWDVWALANAFAGGSRFQLFHGGDYWFLYGSAKKGTWAGYVLSTDTVWSCQDQNSGIVAIYGIKY